MYTIFQNMNAKWTSEQKEKSESEAETHYIVHYILKHRKPYYPLCLLKNQIYKMALQEIIIVNLNNNYLANESS